MELKSSEIIAKVGKFLQQSIPTRHSALESHLIGLEALRLDLAKECVDSMQLLYEKRKQMLWPKDAEKGLTELDRTTRLNGDVAILEKDYQFLLRLESLVESRIQIATTFLTS